MDESSVARYLPHIQGYFFPKSRDRSKVRGSSQGRAKAGGRAGKRWERGVNQCLSSPESTADLYQLLLGLSEKGLTGMRAYVAYRESCFYLFTSSRG